MEVVFTGQMSRRNPMYNQYDPSHDESDSDLEDYMDGPVDRKSEPRVSRTAPVYQEKYRQIESILDRGVSMCWVNSPDNHLVIELLLPYEMWRNIRSVRIRVDDPQHWAVMSFKGCLSSTVSGVENCDGLDSLKWALSGVLNLYYLAADTSMAAHPLHREKSKIPPVRSIPRHDGLDETWEHQRAPSADGAAGGRVRRSSFTPRRA